MIHRSHLTHMRRAIASLILACPITCVAQGTLTDYNRAYEVYRTFSDNQVFYHHVNPNWIGDSDRFWYIRNTPEGNQYVIVDAGKASREPLFNQGRLAAALEKATGGKVNEKYLPLGNFSVTTSADTLWFTYQKGWWRYAVTADKLERTGDVPAPRKQRHWMEVDDEKGHGPVTSPDGKRTAYIRNDNVYVRDNTTGKEQQLSLDGTPGNYYSSYISWAPDSRHLSAVRIRPVEKRFVYYVESSPKDQLQPKLHKQEYAKPGDELPFRVPCLFDAGTGKAFTPSTELFASQYYVSAPVWDKDSRHVTFEYNERGHKTYRLLEMSAEDGNVRTLIEEKEEKYVNYPRIYRHHLSDGRHIIWSSERDNYNHLYLYDRKTARPVRQITKGEWYVREVQYVDEENKQIYFSANGMVPDEDPYLIRYYRIGFDGKGLTCLTPEKGMHKAWYSADHRYLVDLYSQVDVPPVAVVRNAKDGRVVMSLEKADISRLTAAGWKAPEVFAAPGRDGKTLMWGNIYRPSNFDPSRTYPVIEYIYSGPGDHYVPKTFIAHNWLTTSLAELGFIVVQVDGMTTSYRSKEFEEVCYKNLKDAGLPDHIAWIKAAAKRYPQIDTTRVGIYGMSAGGQESTAAVLFHPEFYKAAYSACGCHDNRMDKIWWNELWMGYPVDSSYISSSNAANAHLLTRPLMLMVGEMDDNVDPASTMQVVDALIKADKDFELIVVPGARHSMGDAFGEHKRYDFFVRHLMGITPPAWNEVKTR